MTDENAQKDLCGLCENTVAAAKRGHLACLRQMHERGDLWHPQTTGFAALNGNVNILEYAVLHNCYWDKETAADSTCAPTTACLRYIYENCGHLAPWDERLKAAVLWRTSYYDQREGQKTDEMIDFLNAVKDDWKSGANVHVVQLKPAKH